MIIEDLETAKSELLALAIMGGAQLDLNPETNEIEAYFSTQDNGQGQSAHYIWRISDQTIKNNRDVQIMAHQMDQMFKTPFNVLNNETLQDRISYLAEHFKENVENDAGTRPSPLATHLPNMTEETADPFIEDLACGQPDCVFFAPQTKSAVDILKRQLLSGYMVWACGEKPNPALKQETALKSAQIVLSNVEKAYSYLQDLDAEKGA